ncbi:hypothetical protein V5799_004579 [Amblyomma americanum]|uniref:Uncharacterized protein n=1 Tax=Amblyomma americanum TaxID=6943 RepID=A0AAQ4D5P8_AMBAM
MHSWETWKLGEIGNVNLVDTLRLHQTTEQVKTADWLENRNGSTGCDLPVLLSHHSETLAFCLFFQPIRQPRKAFHEHSQGHWTALKIELPCESRGSCTRALSLRKLVIFYHRLANIGDYFCSFTLASN